MQVLRVLTFATTLVATLPAHTAEPFTAADVVAEREVHSPALSPDGRWVAYVTSVADREKDEDNADLWMASWDGTENLQLTHSPTSESLPRWSPDGRFLGFLAARGEDADASDQVWLLDRRGGEARVLTDFPGGVKDFAWSPDGRRLALIVRDPDTRKPAKADATPPPIVIDRFYFKEDETGYLGPERNRLYLYDIATREARRLTTSPHDESRPAWSPDGTRIAFYGRESEDPDRDVQFTLFTVEPRAGATPKRLAHFQGENGDSTFMGRPAWSPDGRQIAWVAGGDPKLIYYARHGVHVVASRGGEPRALGASLDRNTTEPRWSPDGSAIYVLLEDDRNQHLARITLDGDRIERVLDGRRETTAYDIGSDGRLVLLDATVAHPAEVFALDGGTTRALSRQNEAWLATRTLASVEETAFPSADGTTIHGFLVKPPGWRKGRSYPAILQIHGGPVSQYANAFMTEWQIYASAGYVVIASNPRGSSGRGQDFATAIWADWGGKDGEDVIAAVDHALREGIADPERLGVGGWSYGGILTNQVIVRDTRFKAATSGSGIANALAGYGTDMYTREYELELGLPWKNHQAYLAVSAPFLHADRIRTPTLFLCGEKDFNVPLLNSEQMYQALRSLGVDTRLVIYPGQFHSLSVPSYRVDRMERYLAWFAKYLRH